MHHAPHAERLSSFQHDQHELENFTRDLLASGVQADLLAAAIQIQCAAAPGAGIRIQVEKDRSAELAASLARVVKDPMTVRVTDARGKPMTLRPGCTHAELAELVCRSGCEVHVPPDGRAAETAASLANGVNGRVLIPGAGPLNGATVIEDAMQALRSGDQARLAVFGQDLERLGLLNVSQASRAFYAAITGTEIAGVEEEWTVAMNYAFRSWQARGCITLASAPAASAPVEDDVLAASASTSAAEAITLSAAEEAPDQNLTRFAGDANAMELLELAQFIHVSGKTGALTVADGEAGLCLWFRAGELIHAECGTTTGLDAALRLTATRDARSPFAFTADVIPPSASISVATPMLLLDLSRQLDEQDF